MTAKAALEASRRKNYVISEKLHFHFMGEYSKLDGEDDGYSRKN